MKDISNIFALTLLLFTLIGCLPKGPAKVKWLGRPMTTIPNDPPTTDPLPTPPSLNGEAYFGLSSAAGIKSSGQYDLGANVGNQGSVILKTSGSYKLYGGIQGAVVSQ